MSKKSAVESLIVRERARRKTWFDKLSEDQQQDMLKVRELVQSDDSIHVRPTARNLIQHYQIEISPQVLANWLKS